jgi:hypothetical protein
MSSLLGRLGNREECHTKRRPAKILLSTAAGARSVDSTCTDESLHSDSTNSIPMSTTTQHQQHQSQKRQDWKMIRQESYRNLPSVSDCHKDDFSSTNKNNKHEFNHDHDHDLPGLATSLNLESFFEEAEAEAEAENVQEERGGDETRIITCSGQMNKEHLERHHVVTNCKSYEKGVKDYDANYIRLENSIHNDIDDDIDDDDDDDDDDDLSYDSREYGHDSRSSSDDNDDGNKHDNDNLLICGNRDISDIIESFIKDDQLSDSSDDDEGEEKYFIERKEHRKKLDKIPFFKVRSEPIMLIDHYNALHTIDEEGSEYYSDEDDESVQARTAKEMLNPGLKNRYKILRLQSDLTDYRYNHHQQHQQEISLSVELLRNMTKDTTNSSSICSGSSSIHCSNDSEGVDIQEEVLLEDENTVDATIWESRASFARRCNNSNRWRKVRIKAIIAISMLLLIAFFTLVSRLVILGETKD